MKILILLIPFIISAYLSKAIIPIIYLISYKKRLFDPVDKRKIHGSIIPRLGGVAFAPIQCCLMTLAVMIFHKYNFLNDLHLDTGEILPMFLLLTTGLVVLFVVGITDDLIGMNYKCKFVAQLIVALLLPFSGLWINDLYGILSIHALPAWIGMPLTVFIVMLIINAINLIDGIDGLCSGLIMVSCFIFGVLFAISDAWLHAIFAFVTTGFLIPFWHFNVFGASKRKRRIFMGDTGSMTLGFSIAFLAISFSMNNQAIKPFSQGAIISALMTLIVPVLDVARVIFERLSNGQSAFEPDRRHIHHKLLELGLSDRATMACIILLALFFSLFNIIGVQYIDNNMILVLDGVLWTGIHLTYHWIRSNRKQDSKSPRMWEFTKLHLNKKTDFEL